MGRLRRSFFLPRAAVAAHLVILAGCASAPPFDAGAIVSEWAAFMERDYVLRPGDKLAVSVYQAPDLTQEVAVAPTGTIALLRIPEPLLAAGRSMGTFRREVQAAYAKILQNAEVTVLLTEASENTIYVTGEVRKPGPVVYVKGMTLAQAIAGAGGFDIRAKWNDVRLLRYYGRDVNRTHRVDVKSILHEGYPDFLVLPGDVVYCQTSAIADVNDFVDLWIRRNLPIQITGWTIPSGGN